MLTSITLRNYKSFGKEQRVPLQPLTVLVGPNNSGKSCFTSVARLVRNAARGDARTAVGLEGGANFLFHRPSGPDKSLLIAWETPEGRYRTLLGRTPEFTAIDETLTVPEHGEAWARDGSMLRIATTPQPTMLGASPFAGLAFATNPHGPAARFARYQPVLRSLLDSRDVRLALAALRADADVVPNPQLTPDGTGLPAIVGLWRGAYPDRAKELDDFVSACLPELSHVLSLPAPTPGKQRLWARQRDGAEFDAEHLSDGVLYFIGLAMHALEAPKGSLIFIEEPEQSVHPQRLRNILDLLRRIVRDRESQVVLTTHSPTLLREFRDEPESVLLFRRSAEGTVVDPLTKFPDLVSALDRSDPGEMLVNGFLSEPS